MNDTLLFYCKTCGKRQSMENQSGEIPTCHDEPMKPFHPLPECETTMTAEHARLSNFGEACDDNRSGVIEQK
jgi:hypothetical protein